MIEDQHEENKNPSFLVVVVGTGQVYPTLSNKPEKSGVIFFFMIAKLTLLVKLSSRFLLGVPNWLTKWKQGWNSCTSPDSAYSKTKHIFWSIVFVHKYIYVYITSHTNTDEDTHTNADGIFSLLTVVQVECLSAGSKSICSVCLLTVLKNPGLSRPGFGSPVSTAAST